MGLAAKRWAPQISLGTAFIAAQLPDVIWPFLVLAGVERVAIAPGDTLVTPLRFEHYPISHSLLMVAVWGLALGLLGSGRGGSRKGVLMLAGLAVSHWVLDFVSHRPDMPRCPGGRRGGPGPVELLWATLAVEALFAAGIALYLTSAEVQPRRGRLPAFLVGTLAAVPKPIWPPPPNTMAAAVSLIVAAPVLRLCELWIRVSGSTGRGWSSIAESRRLPVVRLPPACRLDQQIPTRRGIAVQRAGLWCSRPLPANSAAR